MANPKQLVKKPKGWSVDINNTMLHQSAYFVEHNLQAAGAVAGVDYTLLDCFKLGAIICLEARIEEIAKTITNAVSGSIEDDCVEESKNINDADEAKPKAKAHFQNVGYQ